MNSLCCKQCGHLYFSHNTYCPIFSYDDSCPIGIEDTLEDLDENYNFNDENIQYYDKDLWDQKI
jgi:hypothetical protein